ncbi:hypothetical protein ACR78Z_24405 [Sphingobacterium thalpophilum]|uniref:hypothetical protein n=1 Tax=Sphingobacterium thalpophilum TaxID=259 RepID=UPI003DA47398
MKEKIIYCCVCSFTALFSMSVKAQVIQVSGRVTSITNGAPISGVTISILGSKAVSQTDGNGQFIIRVSEFNFGSESILTVENPRSIEHFSEDRIHRRAIFLRPNSSGILSYQQAKVAPKLFKTVIGEGFDRMRKTYYRFGNLSKDRQSTQDRKYCGYFAQVWSLDRSGWMLLADVMQF